ncbi:type I-F CRISPR-associated protein Csy1 [Candidatus Methylobacter oryzae]|uniref:Type I-F CRISPR-associated protein Csy1 n=1 Tax=Candidatus Methylobacter oryzae TaxID=2497749 RepID=A0ABY3CBW7_9GAMM|nr:type I-F CRISPR-associated protein Csy1 [Candidatus Methylobacter oryzae]TRW97113.1 type I-F CRISPR-associated protein Csy1 [Candidatus Methylobacter oryzae]
MNQNIPDFFAERKASWLKARLKPSLSDEEQAQLQQEASEKFAPANWLPDAARRAAQLTMVSHPGKFSHPSAKTSSVIAQSQSANDGYLRSGNVEYELDVFGNAAAMDVYKFLSLQLDDGKTVLSHLEQDSATIKPFFTVPTASYESLKQGLTSIKQLDDSNRTDHLVKQVYFPVNDAYHLLSLLTPSGLLTQVKSRIDSIRFAEETKQAKDSRKKNEHHAQGYNDIFDLTVTAFGGTQPQNVSVLNSQNAGRAYLLASIPPTLKQRQIRLPTHNFFSNSLRVKQFKDNFQSLDKLIRSGVNNVHVRDGITNTLKYIIDQVLQRAFRIRLNGEHGWSNTEHYQSLPLAQRIWLDDANLDQRENQDAWLDDVVGDFARWILDSYEYLFKETHIKLSDHELREIRGIVEQAVGSDREFFK